MTSVMDTSVTPVLQATSGWLPSASSGPSAEFSEHAGTASAADHMFFGISLCLNAPASSSWSSSCFPLIIVCFYSSTQENLQI